MDRDALIDRYLALTRVTLPAMARERGRQWPVRFDHCFQRILLDHVAGGVWYDEIRRPAFRHMTEDQAERAVALAEAIAQGRADLNALNAQSLAWRGKSRGVGKRPSRDMSASCRNGPRQKTLDL
ncbi:MAG: hypothetical protein AAF618_14805 [Pseudomonadota bacterium]